ncbi:MAG: glutamate dehydrogenase, partial [Rhodanobacteraceae bacterium]
IASLVERYRPGMDALRGTLPKAFTATGRASFEVDMEKWQGLGFSEQLAEDLAEIPVLSAGLDIIETSRESGYRIEQVARVFFELGEALDIEWLRSQIEALPVENGWHAQARGSLRDELASQQRALATQVLTLPVRDGESAVTAWLNRDDPALKFTRSMLDEIRTQNVDYPIASVALRRLAQLAQAGREA